MRNLLGWFLAARLKSVKMMGWDSVSVVRVLARVMVVVAVVSVGVCVWWDGAGRGVGVVFFRCCALVA